MAIDQDPDFRIWERAYGPFTHMSIQETAIWIRYLQQGGQQFAPFVYDVRVGEGVTMPAGSSSFEIRAAAALTTKRIDVICMTKDAIRIIEVKVRAGLSAIGQLIGYRNLYAQTQTVTMPLEMWLITDTLQPDLAGLLDQEHIHYVEVGP